MTLAHPNPRGPLVTVTIVGIALVSNIADAQFRVCPRYTPSGTSVVIRSHHSFGLSTVGQPNPWPTNVSNAYDLSWSGWWYLNTANYAWWWGRGFVSNGYSGWDGVEAIQRSNGFGLVGQTQPYVWPADQIQEADFRIDGPTTSSPASLTDAVSFTSTCIGADQPVFTTETTALVHELGHGYGFGHFNDYLSNMNTFDVGIISCEVGTSPGAGMSMLITPSAQPTQCMDIVYGIPPGIDLSITPLVQPTDCWLAVGDECAQRFGLGPGIPQEFAHAATSGTTTIEFTQLNNLDAYSANPVTAIYFGCGSSATA